MSNKEESKKDGIHFGNQAKVQGDVFTGDKTTTGDIRADHSAIAVGPDAQATANITTSTGLSAAEVAALFDRLYAQIDERPNTSPEDKTDLKTDVQEIQTEAIKGDKADEAFLARRLRNIQRMAPDILDVVIATLANPLAGFSTVVTKVARRMKEVASNS